MSTPETKPRTVLVTGAGGLLGRSASSVFSAGGWKVSSVDHASLDISREEPVARTVMNLTPDLIVNCAAATDVDRCERDPAYAYGANEKGPMYLARAAAEIGAEMVHVSTDYVFDGEREGFYTQEDRPNPLSVYAKSKLAGEQAMQRELDRAYVVRSSWIFGKGGKNFGSRVVDYARAGAALKGVSDQTSIPTYAPDLAGRILEIVQRGVHGLYQVTNTGPTTWFVFSRKALDLAGLASIEIQPATRADMNQPAPRPKNSAMRCLLSEQLGLAPLRHWEEALKEFIQDAYPIVS